MQWDETDLKILAVLQRDGRLNARDIAARIGLSVTPTYERMRRIEQSGVIKKVVALLDRERLNSDTVAFCNVSLQVHSTAAIEQFEKAVSSIPEVLECHHITGNYDYLLKVVVSGMKQYQRFLTRKLAVIDNIAQVHSNFVMTEVKYTTAFPLKQTLSKD